MKEAKLEWVIVDEQPRQVKDFANLPPGRRPNTLCPLCKKPVILKLGNIRVHHAAHYEGAICAATQPETALHLNMKYYLQQVLTGAGLLLVYQTCIGFEVQTDYFYRSMSCSNKRGVEVARDWDRVLLEYPFDGLILDVALVKGDALIAAIEICVTHAVDESKQKLLKQKSVPWVEIKGDEQFYNGDSPWTPSAPLDPLTANYPQEYRSWRCTKCVDELTKAQYQEKLAEKRAQPKPDTYKINNELRFVDMYYPSGKHFREVFNLGHKILSNGTIVNAWLNKGDYKKEEPKLLHRAKPPISSQSFDELKQVFHDYLAELRKRGIKVDSPMHWHEWPKGLNRGQVFFEFDIFPRRYEYQDGSWVFLTEYKDLSWDGFWGNPQKYQRKLLLSHPAKPNHAQERVYETKPRQTYPGPERYEYPARQDSPKTQASLNRTGTCIFCGQVTDEYWYYNGKTGECKCNACLAKGLS